MNTSVVRNGELPLSISDRPHIAKRCLIQEKTNLFTRNEPGRAQNLHRYPIRGPARFTNLDESLRFSFQCPAHLNLSVCPDEPVLYVPPGPGADYCSRDNR